MAISTAGNQLNTDSFKNLGFQNVKPVPSLNLVNVTIKPGKILENYSRTFYDGLEISAGQIPFSREELYDYMCYLVEARVNHVTNKRSIPKSDFAVKIPCFLMFILSQVGNVEIPRLQVKITPSFERTENMVLTSVDDIYAFVTKISSYLSLIVPNAIARCFPSNLDGNEDFMSMTLVENVMCANHAEVEPVMAFASSFLEAKRMNDLITDHVKYSSLERYSTFMSSVAFFGMVVDK